MTNAISILTVEGKTIVNTANLPTQAAGKAVHIKAVHAGKYLLVADQHQTAPQQIVVKRVGKDLLIFTQQGDETPEVVIDGFYDNQGELVGMAADGSYHTYVESGSNREAFLMLTDGGSDTLVMSSQQTTGLSGLAVANSGISNTALAFGIAGGALAAIGALVAAGGGGGSGGGSKNDHPQQQPVSGDAGAIPAPQPNVPYNNVAIDDRGDVLAPIASDSLTNDNQPLLTGQGTPGSNVRVYDNGQLIGSAVVDDNGQWQFKPATALSDASHELSFSEVNSDGVESAQSAPIRFDIDTQPPAAPADVTITDGNGQDLSAGGLSDANPLHFAGKGEPGDTALIYDGDKVMGSAVVGADGQWSADITLPGDGDHSLSVGFTDPAGNSGATTKPVIVDYDITPPAVPTDVAIVDDKGSDLSQGGATNTNPLHLGGTGEPGDTAIIYDGDKPFGTAIVGADGKWSADITLPDQGEHAIGVGMKDPAGNESNKSTPVIVDFDTTAPDAPVIGDLKDGNGADLSAGGLTNNGSVEMSGTGGTEGDIVKLYDGNTLIGSTTVGADGSWTIPADISGDDEHSLSASFTDPAGNESPKSTPVIVDLDTTAPDAPVIGDLKDGNGADLSTGGLTNNGSVEMSGSGGTEGDIVKLYDGTTLIGSTTVGADGSWTIPADISGDDEHSLSASFTDPAGNESPKSTPVIVDLDTTAPDAPVIGDLKDGNGADLSTGGLTNNGSLEMSGTGGNEGDIVKLYDGTTLIGSTTVGADGSWSIPADISGDDEHSLSASFTDPAGNESPKSTPVIVDLDTTAPDAPVIGDLKDGNGADLSAGGLTNNGSVEMSGTGGTEGDIVKLYDGTTLIGSTTVGADGSWTIPADISGDDEHSLSASFTDPAGNEGPKSTPVIVDLDTTPPDAPVIGDLKDGNGADLSAGGLTNNGSVEMSGTGGTEGDVVKLYDGTTLIGSTIVGADGSWSIPADISGDDEHSLSASFTDPAGNESPKSTPVIVDLDTNAPDAPVIGGLTDGNGADLGAGGLTNNGSLEMSGTGGTEGDIVKLYDGNTLIGSTTVGADGSWSIPADISGDDEHSLSASFTDPAGNESPKSTPVIVDLDTTAPDAPVFDAVSDGKGSNLLAGGLTNNGSLTLSGTGTFGDIVKIYDGATVVGSAMVGADGSWTIPANISGDTEHELSATYTDPAGNESLHSALVTVDLDTTPPDAPLISAIHDGKGTPTDLTNGGITNNKTLVVEGSGGTQGETVRIYSGTTLLGSAVVNADGSWSVRTTQSIEGAHDISATYTDLAGNESLNSAGSSITLDTKVATMGAPIITNSSGSAIGYGANTNEVRPLVSGTSEPFATITLRIALSQNQGWGAGNRVFTTTADENGNWSIQVVQKLPDGDMFFRTSQTDLAGNTSPLGSQGKIHILGGSSAAAGPDPVQPMSIDSTSDEHSSQLTTDHAHTQPIDDVQHSNAAPVEETPVVAAVAEPAPEAAEPTQPQEKVESDAAPMVADDHPVSLANLPELQQEAHTVALEGNGTEDHIKITIDDVLTFGKEDLLIEDGHKQLLVTGDENDSVSLEAVNGDKGIQNWNAQGEVTVEGTVYNIYQNDNHDVDVLIQQGVQTHHN